MTWANFKLEEFACRCGCGQNRIRPETVDRLQRVRDRVGFALPVSSGYRCPNHNANVSTTGATGPHTTGQAVDIPVDRSRALRLIQAALAEGFTGLGVQQKGKVRFIHLDDLGNAPGQPRPTVWSY